MISGGMMWGHGLLGNLGLVVAMLVIASRKKTGKRAGCFVVRGSRRRLGRRSAGSGISPSLGAAGGFSPPGRIMIPDVRSEAALQSKKMTQRGQR